MDYIIAWQSHEYEYVEKNADWYWAMGIVVVAVAVVSFMVGNILFGIVILLGGFSLAIHAARKPALQNFEINQKGVMVDNILYPYVTLDSFWVDDLSSPHPKIILKSGKFLMPQIILPYPANEDPEEVRDYISYYLPEEEMYEPITHKLMEYLGF
jgi:hypothetical protein